MGAREIAAFLTYLTVERKVSDSTQHQTFNALVFLNKKVLNIPLDNFDFKHARIGKRLPVVLSRDEAKDMRTAMRYTHVLNRNKFNVRNPLGI